MLLTATIAQATTYTVTTTADTSDGSCNATLCSFRDALAAAGTGDTVIVPAGTYKGAMLAGNGVWAPSGQFTIQGAGAGRTIIDGNGLSRTFAFYGQITVSGVTVTGGQAPSAGCSCGGAFEVRQGGYLTLINSVVQGNSAPFGGGGIDVDSASKAILQNVAVTQNTSTSNGGGIHVGPASGNSGTLVMNNVTISGNSTTGTAVGGGLDNQGSTTGTNVTFAGNTSAAAGGAVVNEPTGSLALTNATIATNTTPGLGAGIRNLAAAGAVTLSNSIVVDGCSGVATPAVSSQGHNLDAGSSCGFAAPGDLTNANPKLGPFGDNGGSTGLLTMALLAGSPAIDGGNNAACPATDARGISRPQGLLCDIGAVEYAPPTLALGAVTGITSSSGSLNGTVNPSLRDATYHFDYGTTTAYGSATPALDAGAGSTAAPVTSSVSGLAPGTTYHYRLVATNGDGTSTTGDATFTTTTPSPPPPPSTTPPVLSQVSQSAAHWIEGNARPGISRKSKRPFGTTFTFTLDQSALVTFAFTQSVSGKRVAGKCTLQTRRNQHKPRCGLTITRGTLTWGGHAGKNKVLFQGRLSSTTKLKPGRYTLVITAVNSRGQRSAPKTLTFTVLKP